MTFILLLFVMFLLFITFFMFIVLLQVLMLWCLLIILSAATIVHRVVFGVCSILDIHYVATSVHHVVFSLSMASTTPTLAFFCMLEFCWRWKVVGWLFWPKTLPFKYVHCFP